MHSVLTVPLTAWTVSGKNRKWRGALGVAMTGERRKRTETNGVQIFRDFPKAAVRKAALFGFTFSPVLLRAVLKNTTRLNA